MRWCSADMMTLVAALGDSGAVSCPQPTVVTAFAGSEAVSELGLSTRSCRLGIVRSEDGGFIPRLRLLKKRPQRGGAWGRLTEPPTEGGVSSNREPLRSTPPSTGIKAACQ